MPGDGVVEQPQGDSSAQKRRSTRIVQAVPVMVSGVDALGQPFKEHTSTLIINCHGCKYQSKHYVLKNTWVTLEVAHPEAGQAPRQVRAKILWIQRPRTVQELFQVGAEMEISGNIWGIAFPPEDWFPYPEAALPSIPAPAQKAPVAAPPVVPAPPAAPTVVGRTSARGGLPEENHGPVAGLPAPPPETPAEPAPPLADDKVRQMPRPGMEAEYSATLTRQMGRLLEEARRQLQVTVRDAAASAVAAETGQLLRDLNAQLQNASKQVVERVAAAAVEQMVARAKEQFERERDASNQVTREQWAEEAENSLREAMQQMNARLAESGEFSRRQFGEQVEAGAAHARRHLEEMEQRIGALRGEIGSAAEAAEARIEALRAELDAAGEAREQDWHQRLLKQAEEGIVRLGVLEHEARALNDRIAAIAGDALAAWRGKLESEIGVADGKWSAAIEGSLAAAAEKLSARIAEISQAASAATETQMAARTAAVQQAIEETTSALQDQADAMRAAQEKDLERARAAAAELEAAAKRFDEFAARMSAAGQRATEELDRRFEAAVQAHGPEMSRRGEQIIAEMTEKMKPAFATAAQDSVSSIFEGVQKQMAPHIEKINETLGRLYAGQALADDHLHALPDRLHASTEQYVRESTSRMQALVAQMETEFGEANQRTLEKALAELDEKATDASHTAFEGLYKAADWYQKKAQTAMQTALEKAMEQTSATLREKAAEMSRLFTTELDHYSRSFAEHSRGMLEESARDMLDKTRGQLGQAAETTVASFGDEIHRNAQQKLETFAAETRSALEGVSAQLDGQAQATGSQVEARAKQAQLQTDAHIGESLSEFQNRVARRMEQAVGEANQEFQTSLLPILDSLRTQREAQQREWSESLMRQSNESVESYKERLQNVSNSWMVASVTALNSHSQTLMNSLTLTAEQRLREACSQAFTGLAETLRDRMMGLSAEFLEGFKPKEK